MVAESPSEDGSRPVLRLSLEEIGAVPAGPAGHWRTTWRLQNPMSVPVEVLEAWLPHDQFHAERQRFRPALALPAGGEILFSVEVSFASRDGEAVENAFLILRARYDRDLWRVFARLRIENDKTGSPVPIIEALTTDRAGLSAPAGQLRPGA
jgi:hypothetical protein